MLYKYLNPHLLVVAVFDPTVNRLTINLLDNVSGQILRQFRHDSVDVSKGVKIQVIENIVFWSYYSIGDTNDQSRGTGITVAELYESLLKNEKYNMFDFSRSFN